MPLNAAVATGIASSHYAANLRGNGIWIDVEQLMHAERAHIGNAQGSVPGELLLDGQIPFLNRRSLGVWLNSLRRINCVRRWRPGLNGESAISKNVAHKSGGAVIGRQGIL